MPGPEPMQSWKHSTVDVDEGTFSSSVAFRAKRCRCVHGSLGDGNSGRLPAGPPHRKMTRTLGILGGTFDPIHYGHLRFAAEVRSMLGLAQIHLVPSGVPPHRAAPFASSEDRLTMTTLGCAEFPGLVADGREVRRPGPSYTVVTLQELHAQDLTRPLALLLGSDALHSLATWYHWEQLFTLAHLVVVERPGDAFDAEKLPPALREQWERRLTTDPSRLSRGLAGTILRLTVVPQ